jgi:non-canonical (house-cleaning) NTP pyrophosphatase
MTRFIVAVGSTRRPKLNAVRDALDAFAPLLAPSAVFEVTGAEVPSGVSHTPASREELMLGARRRVEALMEVAAKQSENWSYFVGLEGGLEVALERDFRAGESHRRVFLESWAYVSDGARGFYGRSGAVEMPQTLAAEVLDCGVELSVAIDRFAGEAGIRDAQGAWGVLSRNLISRQEAFRVAVIAAFAPFYNAKAYHRTAASAGM